ncbi:MAG: hypothetical protein KAX57_06520 [Rhodoferax sp.]|jgi:hypothetical protein|uniref:hypothetical protein n=1 Tax=Rhodoferax sp. TaxID=50421 RepID=UPI001B579C33|nr:hypothetical protein [Rhodoferax sp.]MBP8286478.1 hypothetical protein [Rhodoferax sp.]MBP9148501.1 hypothetical protein [Rhodoferax sp.]MBP9736204.1 hypothetical protein [Rhodoferax sp.]
MQAEQSTQGDPVIAQLLGKLPDDMRSSFSEAQLLALKIALGSRAWDRHTLDFRWTLKFWQWQYYLVVVAGRNRRTMTARERRLQELSLTFFVSVFLMFSTILGIFVVYIIKSALGIDLIPGFSFGVWDWFQAQFLR